MFDGVLFTNYIALAIDPFLGIAYGTVLNLIGPGGLVEGVCQGPYTLFGPRAQARAHVPLGRIATPL